MADSPVQCHGRKGTKQGESIQDCLQDDLEITVKPLLRENFSRVKTIPVYIGLDSCVEDFVRKDCTLWQSTQLVTAVKEKLGKHSSDHDQIVLKPDHLRLDGELCYRDWARLLLGLNKSVLKHHKDIVYVSCSCNLHKCV